MARKLPQIQRQRASDSVYQVLRDAILTRMFHSGERLNIRELANKLDVSLTPVKEAVNRLATEGLIEIRPRAGTFVTDVSPEDVAETFEIRLALESLAVEKCLERIRPEDLQRLGQILSDLEAPLKTEKDRIFHERKNEEFHRLLVELSGNRKLLEMYRSLNSHIKIARIHRSHEQWAERLQEEKKEHLAILKALQSRNRDGLIQAIRRHIQRAAHSLVEDLKENIVAARPAREA